MALFLSNYENKLDKKGRVSVPAAFRNQLVNEAFPGIVAFPAPKQEAIEACGFARFETMQPILSKLNPFGEDFNTLVTLLASEAQPMQFDAEGRINLTDRLIARAGIKDKVVFAGRMNTFQIWSPEKYEENLLQAMKDVSSTSDKYQELMQSPVTAPGAAATPQSGGAGA